MTAARRLSQLVATAAIGALGVLLILESSDVVAGGWRRWIADAIASSAFPDWGLWASALVGAALALVGIALTVAQLAPPKRGNTTMHEVYRGSDGDTRLRGRAAIRAVCHEIEQEDGVVSCAATITRKKVAAEVLVDDRSNLASLETAIRNRLGHEFWIDLGLADFSVELTFTHHPNPPRVR